jgi:myo-inositol-1(or 4)-monophosphatase
MNTPDPTAETLYEGRDLQEIRQWLSPLLEDIGTTIVALRDGGTMKVEEKRGEGATDGKKFDMVTGGDKLSEKLIREAVQERFPEDSFRGEEEGVKKGTNGFRWENDPIDGTYNFHRSDESCISVALLHNGEPVLGIVHFLHESTQMYAVKGGGAFQYDCARKEEKPLKVEAGSSPEELAQCHMAWDIGHGDMDTQMKMFMTLRPHVRYMTSHACYPVSVRRVLRNNRDAYLNPGAKSYDMAASIIIAQEAGAVVSGITEETVDLTKQGVIPTIITRNIAILRQMKAVLNIAQI